MFNSFGSNRVVECKGTVPTIAWKLDNSLEISDNEMLISVDTIKLEESNFRQICNECEYNKAKIGRKIQYIVNKRGKLHNPVTDSGGICSGRIVRAGSSYSRSDIPDKETRIICATSLTSLPMYIESVEDVDFNYSLIMVKGYVIAFESTMIVPLPKDIDTPRALYIMDEMGSMKKAYTLSRPEKKIFILGDGLLNMLFYTAVARKAVGRDGYIVAAVYKGAMQSLSKNEIKRILEPYADHVYFTDILKPLDCYESFRLEEPELFDLSINCANMLGGEALSVMLTKTRGDILFTSLTSNFNSVALFAESLGKELRLTPIEEFSSGSLEFNLDFVREIKSDIDMIDEIFKSHRLIKQLPMRVSELNNTQDIDNIDKVEGFVFGSNKTKKILMEVINIATYDCNVIIQGETGTGKEKILNLIYKNSIRKTKPCIKINCATIYENLAESEFFGYEPGAFTGAGANRKLGYFELANGGILFLDEIGELSLNMQSKLLRALQEKNFYRVGGQELVEVDVRVICANNVDLRTLVKEGKFREDLYYRLSVCEIKVPPLRERNEDIACIAEYLINEYNFQYNTNKSFSADGIEVLEKYNWPGNVRELDNVVHRLVVNCQSDLLTSEDVTNAVSSNLYKENPDMPSETDTASRHSGLKSTVGEFERDILAAALEEGGSTRAAAKALGISQSQVMRKKKKYNL